MDRGAWQAIVLGAAKTQTGMKQLSIHAQWGSVSYGDDLGSGPCFCDLCTSGLGVGLYTQISEGWGEVEAHILGSSHCLWTQQPPV